VSDDQEGPGGPQGTAEPPRVGPPATRRPLEEAERALVEARLREYEEMDQRLLRGPLRPGAVALGGALAVLALGGLGHSEVALGIAALLTISYLGLGIYLRPFRGAFRILRDETQGVLDSGEAEVTRHRVRRAARRVGEEDVLWVLEEGPGELLVLWDPELEEPAAFPGVELELVWQRASGEEGDLLRVRTSGERLEVLDLGAEAELRTWAEEGELVWRRGELGELLGED